ncbi:MAG: non-ribosomal peptide synthetase, partial [Acidobacteria bacterium]
MGTPVANRNRAEIEGLIGFFANTLVLRTNLAGNPSFRELLGRVKETALSAYAHEDIPFEKLVDELRPERSLSHNPIFQVLFSVRHEPVREFEISNLKFEFIENEGETSKFDLSFFLAEEAGEIRARLEYN